MHKRNQSKWKFLDFRVLRSKFTKFLSFLKQQISFSLTFASLFSVMRKKSSILFQLIFYVHSAKGAYQSTNLVKFHVSSRNSEILHFDGFLLSKSYKVSAKKVQKSNLTWEWRVMQSLKKNWLVVMGIIKQCTHRNSIPSTPNWSPPTQNIFPPTPIHPK